MDVHEAFSGVEMSDDTCSVIWYCASVVELSYRVAAGWTEKNRDLTLGGRCRDQRLPFSDMILGLQKTQRAAG